MRPLCLLVVLLVVSKPPTALTYLDTLALPLKILAVNVSMVISMTLMCFMETPRAFQLFKVKLFAALTMLKEGI
jgi:hypothetical protein